MHLSTIAFIATFILFFIAGLVGYNGDSEGHSEGNLLAFIMLSTGFICKSIEQKDH